MMIATFAERRRRLAVILAVLHHKSLECASASDAISASSTILHWINTGDEPSGAALAQFPQRHTEADAA